MIINKKKYLTISLIVFISTQMYGQVNTCGSQQSYFPVDMRILSISDSLQKEGTDTILIYSHRLSTGSFNGYGKVIWKKHGNCYQIKVPFHNKAGMYGLGNQH